MSYCRFGAIDKYGKYMPRCSDVYVYASTEAESANPLWCIHVSYYARRRNCRGHWYTVTSRENCLMKLRDLRKAGYIIPGYAFERLKKEIKEHAQISN